MVLSGPGRETSRPEEPAGMGHVSVFSVPGMDCPTEAGLVRMTLGELAEVASVAIDLELRRVTVEHLGNAEAIRTKLAGLGFGAELLDGSAAMVDRRRVPADLASERAVLQAVLVINAAMFVVELIAGWLAESTGLLADSLDMLADALVYVVGLYVVGRSVKAQHRAALLAGAMQVIMGLGVVAEVARRAIVGSDPLSLTMIATASAALVANLACARLLSAHRDAGAHMKASWIFTATDAVANLGVILAGALVLTTGSGVPDLVVGGAIAAFVLYGALRIVRLSTSAAK